MTRSSSTLLVFSVWSVARMGDSFGRAARARAATLHATLRGGAGIAGRTAADVQLVRAGGVDDGAHARDAVGGEAAGRGVLADRLFAVRAVHAIDLVAGDVALDPLDVGAHRCQHA